MNKKMRILAALAAAVIAISATAMLSGCGGNKDGDKTATTVPATTALATTKAAESSAANGNNGNGSAAQDSQTSDSDSQDNQTSDSDSQDNNNGNNEVVEKHGNITRDEAGEIALSNVPYGQTITICTPGTYEGKDCWAVGVADTTGKVYEVYVSSIFCEYNLATQAENPDLQPDAQVDDSSSAN
ncbi:MAG: hypothetical protein IJ598_09900 [Ruminococcus sp.]|nr:hypothetical protein [Ruminococcus sp.]